MSTDKFMIDFVPSACEGESPAFKGLVKIAPPTVIERFNYIDEMDVDPAMFDGGETSTADYIKVARSLFPLAEKHIREVDLVKTSNDYKIDSVDKLMTDRACVNIVMEIASAILNGFELGN